MNSFEYRETIKEIKENLEKAYLDDFERICLLMDLTDKIKKRIKENLDNE